MLDFCMVAGGTGGHIFPALSVADALNAIGYRIAWVGQPDSLEAKTAAENQYRFYPLNSPAWYGAGIKGKLLLPITLSKSVLHAMRLLKKYQPKVVVAFGGHITVPLGLAAFLLRIPLVIHEQNTIPGLANRLLALFATRILTGFPGPFSYTKKTIHTGNPLRTPIQKAAFQSSTEVPNLSSPLRILVLGGSKGSSGLNHLAVKALGAIEHDIMIWHQTGVHDADAIRDAYQAKHKDAQVAHFIDDMVAAYTWADVVISRAGAISMTEIIAMGVPCILVPNPRCANNHQWFNAKMLSDQEAAYVVTELDPQAAAIIQHIILSWGMNPVRYHKVAKALRAFSTLDSVQMLVSACAKLHPHYDDVFSESV